MLLGDQLVIDVGDIDDPRHLIAAVGEITFDRVKNHRPNHMADMTFLINGRPAQIDADLAGRDRLEGLFLLSEGVIDAEDHRGGISDFGFLILDLFGLEHRRGARAPSSAMVAAWSLTIFL